MNSGLGVVGGSGMFRQRRLWFVWMLLQVIVSGSFVAKWGCGWMQGWLCWVKIGWVWGWGRLLGVSVVSFLAWLLSSFRFGGSVPNLMGEEVGLMSRLWPLSDVKLEWRDGFVVAEVRRFESTMVLQAIWCSGRASVWKLLVIDGLLVWIDVEGGFEARNGGLGEVCRRVCWCLQTLGSSEFTRSDRFQRLMMLAVADSGTRWFGCGVGVVTVMVDDPSSILNLSALKFYVFMLFLVFGSVFRSQINLCSFESELLSRILTGNWIWVIGLMFIRSSLLPALSCVIDYQPALRTLTLLSMSNARKGYPKGRPDQLCYFLVNLTQCITHSCSRLDPLTSQLPLLRVRISSFSFRFMSSFMYVVVDVCPMGAALVAVY